MVSLGVGYLLVPRQFNRISLDLVAQHTASSLPGDLLLPASCAVCPVVVSFASIWFGLEFPILDFPGTPLLDFHLRPPNLRILVPAGFICPSI